VVLALLLIGQTIVPEHDPGAEAVRLEGDDDPGAARRDVGSVK
jgi:hypothetical protein